MTGLPRFGPCNGYKVASNTRLAGAFLSIQTTLPVQRSRLILIHCTTSMSLRSSYSSLLNRMRKSSPTRTGPKMLRRTFLSNTLKAASSVLNRVHATFLFSSQSFSMESRYLRTVLNRGFTPNKPIYYLISLHC